MHPIGRIGGETAEKRSFSYIWVKEVLQTCVPGGRTQL